MSIFSIFSKKSPDDIYKAIARNIVITSLQYRKRLADEPNHLTAHAGMELAYLLLHMLDRIALQTLGSDKRNEVFDAVCKIVIEDYVCSLRGNAPAELKEELKNKMVSDMDERQMIYSQCDSLLGSGIVPSIGTIIFAFCFFKHKALERTKREDVCSILTGKQNLTVNDIDDFPDIFEIFEETAYIGIILPRLNYQKLLNKMK